jgi:TPR repeat protein
MQTFSQQRRAKMLAAQPEGSFPSDFQHYLDMELEHYKDSPQLSPNEIKERAEESFRNALDGSAFAMFEIGLRYGRPGKDQEIAFKWFYMAAKAGHAGSMSIVAYRYFSGIGVSRDPKKGHEWRKKAAKDVDANETHWYELGNDYWFGLGTRKNLALAVQWFRKSAKAGWPDGKIMLAMAHFNGEGVPRKNYKRAFELLKSTYLDECECSIVGMQMLAHMYRHGLGTKKNLEEANKLAERVSAAHRALIEDGKTEPSIAKLCAERESAKAKRPSRTRFCSNERWADRSRFPDCRFLHLFYDSDGERYYLCEHSPDTRPTVRDFEFRCGAVAVLRSPHCLAKNLREPRREGELRCPWALARHLQSRCGDNEGGAAGNDSMLCKYFNENTGGCNSNDYFAKG